MPLRLSPVSLESSLFLFTTISHKVFSSFPSPAPCQIFPQTHPSSSAARRHTLLYSSFLLPDPSTPTNLGARSAGTYAPRPCSPHAHQYPNQLPSPSHPSHEARI